MISVQVGNRKIGITFEREYREVIQNDAGGSILLAQRTPIALYCNLHRLGEDGKSEAIVARSRAACSSREQFRYEVGRRLTLARALKSYGLTRGERTLVWQTYLGRPRIAAPKVQSASEAITVINLVDDSLPIRRIRAAIESIPVLDGEEVQQADGYKEPASALAQLDLHAGEV